MIAAALGFAAAAFAVCGVGALVGEWRQRERGAPIARRLAAVVPARLRPPLDLAARIEAAGRPGGIGAGEVMALKVGAAVLVVPFATLSGSLAPGRLGVVCAVAGPVVAFLAPDMWLARRARERIRTTRRDLPSLLDLLRVAVDAGMAPSRALAAVAERSAAPLAREWGAVAQQVQLGVPLTEALGLLARRLPSAEITAFAGALSRAAVHGAPLSDTLEAQARDARLARRRRIEEEAAKAAPKIQLVVALLLVPSVLLIVAAALAAALLGGHSELLPR